MMEFRIRADKSGGEESRDAEGRWPIAGVELVGKPDVRHGFSDTFVAKAMADGYVEFEGMHAAFTTGYTRNPVVTGDVMVLHLTTGDLRYRVLEHPGKYADDSEPSGYRVIHEYTCELEG